MKWDLSSDVGLDAALCYFEAKHDPELAQQLAEYFNQRLKDADVVTIQEPLFVRYFRIVMGRMTKLSIWRRGMGRGALA